MDLLTLPGRNLVSHVVEEGQEDLGIAVCGNEACKLAGGRLNGSNDVDAGAVVNLEDAQRGLISSTKGGSWWHGLGMGCCGKCVVRTCETLSFKAGCPRNSRHILRLARSGFFVKRMV